VGTVSKAMTLLTLFTPERSTIGLSEFARLAKMNKATTHRLLGELLAFGMVEQEQAAKTYRLGSEVLRLAALRELAVPMMAVVQKALKSLSDETHETAHMSMVQGDNLITYAHVYSTRFATGVMMEDAEVLSFHATSSGKAILAFADQKFQNRILSKPLTKHTQQTATDPAVVRTMLREVEETGVAVSTGGYEAEVHSFAAPVFNAQRNPFAAVAVAMPVSRMEAIPANKIARAVSTRADQVTRAVGGIWPSNYPGMPG